MTGSASVRPAFDRIIAIDSLRGVAVLGILFMNIQGFAMVFEAYGYPPAHMDATGANLTVWAVAQTFFAVKFITIFSALFGAGVLLMVGEDEVSPRKGLHYRRMGWLLVIGLAHAYLLWWGDILVSYALIGFIIVGARRMKPSSLIVFGLVLISLSGLLLVGAMASFNLIPGEIDPVEYGMALSAEDLEATVALHQAGWLDRFPNNAVHAAIGELAGLIMLGPRTVGVMFIGMALYKNGFLKAAWSTGAYVTTAVIALVIGWSLSGFSAWTGVSGGFALTAMWIQEGSNYVGSLAVALGYAAVIMALCRSGVLGFAMRVLAATGRMALTNYLSQSLIMTFIFVGPPGLGYFGEIERTGQVMLVLAVWALQLTWSPIWLNFFRFGPMEWVWRSLTYGKFQPLIGKAGSPLPGASPMDAGAGGPKD